MADQTPGGAVVSFGGTAIASMTYVASIGFPTIPSTPVEVYEELLGQTLPVDMLNGVAAPRKTTLTCTVLVRALDADTSAATAWADVMSGYRTLAGLPETGTLVVKLDATSSSTVSCQARRKPLNLTLAPQNARSLLVPLEFTLLTVWA